MKLTPYEAARLYLGVKLHFTSDKYDFFKYGGAPMSRETFEARKDKFFFVKLANKYKQEEYIDFLVSNLIKNPKTFSRELVSEDSEFVFRQHQKTIESIEYLFSEDIGKLLLWAETNSKTLDDLLAIPRKGSYPPLIEMYYNKTIKMETLIILDAVLILFDPWSKRIDDTIIWGKDVKIFKKYTPFVTIKVDVFRKILKDRITQ